MPNNNFIEKAIKMAMKGGYEICGYSEGDLDKDGYDDIEDVSILEVNDFEVIIKGSTWRPFKKRKIWKSVKPISEIFFDPQFWQCLGKKLGLKMTFEYPDEFVDEGSVVKNIRIPEWQWMWHRFIDHLAAEKPANNFFKEILK